jgi:hypothetical protein
VAHGLPVALDVFLVSPLHEDGGPHAGASLSAGSRVKAHGFTKRTKYKALVTSPLVHFLTPGGETGGRWHDDVATVINALVHYRTRDTHPLLKRAATLGWSRRFWSVLSMGTQRAYAQSVSGLPIEQSPLAGVACPYFSDILTLADLPPSPSRLPG